MYLIALPLLVYSGTQVSTKKTESHDITEICPSLTSLGLQEGNINIYNGKIVEPHIILSKI
jgi:hypothetical protein